MEYDLLNRFLGSLKHLDVSIQPCLVKDLEDWQVHDEVIDQLMRFGSTSRIAVQSDDELRTIEKGGFPLAIYSNEGFQWSAKQSKERKTYF